MKIYICGVSECLPFQVGNVARRKITTFQVKRQTIYGEVRKEVMWHSELEDVGKVPIRSEYTGQGGMK